MNPIKESIETQDAKTGAKKFESETKQTPLSGPDAFCRASLIRPHRGQKRQKRQKPNPVG